MKKFTKEQLIERVTVFDDTDELAETLGRMADDSPNSTEIYYLRECQTHMLGMYDLCRDLARALKREMDKAKPPEGDAA